MIKTAREAFEECQRAYIGPGPCYLPEYLRARYKYHQILIRLKILNPRQADRKPS